MRNVPATGTRGVARLDLVFCIPLAFFDCAVGVAFVLDELPAVEGRSVAVDDRETAGLAIDDGGGGASSSVVSPSSALES